MPSPPGGPAVTLLPLPTVFWLHNVEWSLAYSSSISTYQCIKKPDEIVFFLNDLWLIKCKWMTNWGNSHRIKDKKKTIIEKFTFQPHFSWRQKLTDHILFTQQINTHTNSLERLSSEVKCTKYECMNALTATYRHKTILHWKKKQHLFYNVSKPILFHFQEINIYQWKITKTKKLLIMGYSCNQPKIAVMVLDCTVWYNTLATEGNTFLPALRSTIDIMQPLFVTCVYHFEQLSEKTNHSQH